jgi:hypothetical protein|tara:strand:- start:172 stop:342 length:171 start_codon:yes stop_codon:yes gene_type:complete
MSFLKIIFESEFSTEKSIESAFKGVLSIIKCPKWDSFLKNIFKSDFSTEKSNESSF